MNKIKIVILVVCLVLSILLSAIPTQTQAAQIIPVNTVKSYGYSPPITEQKTPTTYEISVSGDKITIGDDQDKTGTFIPKVTINRWEEAQISLTPQFVIGFISSSLSDGKITGSDSSISIDYKATPLKPPYNDAGGLDMIITLKSPPKSNIFPFTYDSQNATAYLQRALTEELKIGQDGIVMLTETEAYDKDGKVLYHRPEHVVNSIFFDHATKSQWYASQAEADKYKTGQVGFLYRMKATDAKGNWVWFNWSLGQGTVIGTIDHKFLDSAVYPVIIGPVGDTFGYTTAGGSDANTAANRLRGVLGTPAGGDGTVDSITVWAYNGGGNINFKPVLVLQSSLAIVANGVGNVGVISTSKAEYTATYTIKPSVTNGVAYYVCVVAENNYDRIYYNSVAGGHILSDTTNSYTTPTDPTDGTPTADFKLSIYATYTPGGGVVAPTVTTQNVTSVEATTATGNGNITATGGENCDIRGIQWGTSTGNYTTNVTSSGNYTTGAFTENLTSLPTGTTIYARAMAHNSAGYGYGAEVTFLTKPSAPTGVSATDGSSTSNVTITFNVSTGADDYYVYRDGGYLAATGNTTSHADTTAAAGTIIPGKALASDGTSSTLVTLSVSGESTNNGTSYSYTVVANNASGNSTASAADTGYRGIGAITYQWQRSTDDSPTGFAVIVGGTTNPYDDAGGVVYPDGRYYQVVENATGAVSSQNSTSDRGYMAADAPSVNTLVATDVEDTTATASGNITDTGGENPSIEGIQWGTLTGTYTNNITNSGNFTTGQFDIGLVGLPEGTTIYYRAEAYNISGGWGYGSEMTFLTKPVAPIGLTASDGTSTSNVTVTWNASTGASDYRLWRDTTDLGFVGNVTAYEDVGAGLPSVTSGAATATDGTSTNNVTVGLVGAFGNVGTTSTYRVQAYDATGYSVNSTPDDGYIGVGALTYQVDRSAADADNTYSQIGGATIVPYSDNAAPAPTLVAGNATASDGTSASYVTLSIAGDSTAVGDGRYWKVEVSADGAATQNSTSDRGYIGVGAEAFQWWSSADNITFNIIVGGITNPYNDTTAPADGSTVYYVCVVSATGATSQNTTVDTGYRMPISLPTVTNGVGATNITVTAARLNGEITSTGNQTPTAVVYWGETDQGNNAALWTNNATIGLEPVGTFYYDAGGLIPGTLYYYRMSANNTAGTAWAAASANFTTLAVLLAPTNFLLGDLGASTATGNWTTGVGATATYGRYKRDSYPTSRTEGELFYGGNGTSTNITGLNLDSVTYYVTLWGQNGVNFSTDVAQNKVGGTTMGMILVFAIITSFGIALWVIGHRERECGFYFASSFMFIVDWVYMRNNAIIGIEPGTDAHWMLMIVIIAVAAFVGWQGVTSLRNRGMRDYFGGNDGGRNANRSLGFFGHGGAPDNPKSHRETTDEYSARLHRMLHPNGPYRRGRR